MLHLPEALGAALEPCPLKGVRIDVKKFRVRLCLELFTSDLLLSLSLLLKKRLLRSALTLTAIGGVQAVEGTPRSEEFSSVLEQDPLGHEWGTGPNDETFGEWCELF